MEKLRESLQHKLNEARKTRVGGEVEHLSGQLFAGTIIKTAAWVLLDCLLVWSALSLGMIVFDWLLPQNECSSLCFIKSKELCCVGGIEVISRLLYGAMIVFLGSTISTRMTSLRTFQHSTTLNVFLLASFLWFFSGTGMSAGVLTLIEIATFFLVFFGYRVGLKYR